MYKMFKPAAAVALAITIGLGSVNSFAGTSRYFADINDDSYGWAADYVDQIAAKGIASGVGDNNFDPASLIKRGDFAVFLNKTMGYSDASGDLFILTDVSSDSYYYQSIINCKYNNAITDTNNFYPEDYITRRAAINMIYNALNEADMIGSNATTDVSMFSDGAELLNTSDIIAVGTLANIGLLVGDHESKLYPNSTLTRAEMAVLIAKTSEYADNKKQEAADKKKAEEEQKIEDAKATVEETEDNKIELKSGNIDTSVVVDSGKSVNASDVFIEIVEQIEEALSIKNGSSVTMKDSSIRSNNYTAISVNDKSSANLENVTVVANDTGAVYVDAASNLTADGLKITNNAVNSVVTDGGKVSLTNSSISNTGASAIDMTAGAEVNIVDSVLESIGKDVNLISIVSDPADSDKQTTLNIKNSNFDKKAVQENGNTIYVTLKDSKVEGDIYMDHHSELTLDLQDGSSYKGFIDPFLYCENINIKLSADSKLELCNDIYVNEFVVENYDGYFDNIIDNGFNIYYDDTEEANYDLYQDVWTLPFGGELRPR